MIEITPTPEFRDKARKELFNSSLRAFPTILEMYLRAFGLGHLDVDVVGARIIKIIRAESEVSYAFQLVGEYLDELADLQ